MAHDIPPYRNMGSFLTTAHDEWTAHIGLSNISKNQACMEEYPSITDFQHRCVSILANLWNRSDDANPIGMATTGSSEAVMLAGLAMKRRWQEQHPGSDQRPNIIFGSNAHVCVSRFAEYFEVESRIVPVNSASRGVVDSAKVEELIDSKTIGIVLTLGSTLTGHYDPIEEIAMRLDDYERKTGMHIPIHVDAASGGFIAPFAPGNDRLIWDFRIPRVQSISTSGHKYGYCPYPIGWIVWQDKVKIPQSLLMESSYLRGTQVGFTFSFSRSSAPIVIQYYLFLHYGRQTFCNRTRSLLLHAGALAFRLEQTGFFQCLSPICRHQDEAQDYPFRGSRGEWPTIHSKDKGARCSSCMYNRSYDGIPIVVFTWSAAVKQECPWVRLGTLSDMMYARGFSIPELAYWLKNWGPKQENVEVLRIVVRRDTQAEIDLAYNGMLECLEILLRAPANLDLAQGE
ncbi:PLP-dependent transferase [Aspergillus nidulans var. acristatus]